jgi:ABC-type transporter Mla subunit MlaD
MRRRTPLQTLASSPTMVGAITTLIVVVAVFLAYNANNGLPFVPTYRVSIEVPNAARLVANNEVRIGGSRVGVIESIEAVRAPAETEAQGSESDAGSETTTDPAGEIVAKLNLKLDKTVEPLPQDSIFRIRYKSSFGLKYLDITRGDGPPAEEGFTFDGVDDTDDPGDTDEVLLSVDEVKDNTNADNGTFIDQTEFDEIGNTFDQRTRNAGRANLVGYGDAFAGRGASLNLAIESLNPLLTNLKPVAEVLVEDDTEFRRFFPELADFARIVAPVADEQAEVFGNMAITFGAISSDVEALQASISGGPPTLETGIRTLPAQQVFLAEFTDLSERLKPGVRQLRLALPDLNDAIVTGTPVLKRTVGMSDDLRTALGELEELVEQPTTMSSLTRLEDTFDNAAPLAEHVVPAQTVCNYWNYFWTLLPEHLTERDSVGYTQRVSLIATPPGSLTLDPGTGTPLTVPGEVETGLSIAGYSGVQANGKAGPAHPSSGEFDPHEWPILHGDPGRPTGQDGNDCQGGQTGYLLGRLPVPGQSKSNPAVVAPDLPGGGPTTVFWNQDGTRELRDTRVASRQP